MRVSWRGACYGPVAGSIDCIRAEGSGGDLTARKHFNTDTLRLRASGALLKIMLGGGKKKKENGEKDTVLPLPCKWV